MAEQQNPIALPTAEDLAAMTDEQVTETRTALEAEAADLREVGDEMTDEQVARAEQVADALDRVDADASRRETETAERQERIRAAQDRLARDPEGNAEGEGEGEGNEPPAETPPADEDEGEAPTAEAIAAAVVSRLVAGATPQAPAPARRRNPRPQTPDTSRRASIVAAASGADLSDMGAVVEEFLNRSRGFNSLGASAGIRQQREVATFARDFGGLTVDNPDFSMESLLSEVTREGRLSGGSLAAAGGWCAPSEIDYGIPALETLDGIINLPTMGMGRGGISFTLGPDFSDIYTSAGFAQTEAEAIAGTTKACVEVDCPDFDEVRLDAVGICVKAPLLTRTAFPEAIQRWLEGTVIANQHKVAARLITAMRTALGTALAPTLTGTPVTWSLLSMVEWHIEMERQAYRLSESQSLEVVLPRWVRVLLRADLANRAGVAERSISNAQIQAHFADRGAMVQFVLNYLEVSTPLTSVAFPSTFEAMVYPAGTFVKGSAAVISLDTLYDTADLQTNVYTAAFAEDGVALVKRQHGGKRITFPVHVTGQTGATDLDQTFLTAQTNADG